MEANFQDDQLNSACNDNVEASPPYLSVAKLEKSKSRNKRRGKMFKAKKSRLAYPLVLQHDGTIERQNEGPTENRLGELGSLDKYYYYYYIIIIIIKTSLMAHPKCAARRIFFKGTL